MSHPSRRPHTVMTPERGKKSGLWGRSLCRVRLHDFRYHQLTYDGLYEFRCKRCGGTP